MVTFEIRTLIYILGITHLIQLLILGWHYRLHRNVPGLGWWLLWSLAEVLAGAGMLLRDIPALELVSVLGFNLFAVAGMMGQYVGLLRFCGKKENRKVLLVLLLLYFLSIFWLTAVRDDIQWRSVLFSVTLAALSFLSTYALLRYRPPGIASSANLALFFFLIHGGIFSIRGWLFLTGTPMRVFESTPLNVMAYLDAIICGLVWTFSFILMMNQRLNQEIREAREEMELIFNTSPDAVLITRLEDGWIVNVNDAFTVLSGYRREEAIGRNVTDLNLWRNLEEREVLVRRLRENRSVQNYETRFFRKDGEALTVSLSAKTIQLHNGLHVISVNRDISERIRAEAERERLIGELQEALKKVKTLSGLLPTCASCRKIRNDKGEWEPMEIYIRERSEADFSHGICPECIEKLYPDLAAEILGK